MGFQTVEVAVADGASEEDGPTGRQNLVTGEAVGDSVDRKTDCHWRAFFQRGDQHLHLLERIAPHRICPIPRSGAYRPFRIERRKTALLCLVLVCRRKLTNQPKNALISGGSLTNYFFPKNLLKGFFDFFEVDP